jgi:hypothetical protein
VSQVLPAAEPVTQKPENGMQALWSWIRTPEGFLITIYGLSVVAWGGMLFLLMCNVAPAMCHPSCNDLYSSRRKWIEIDSQILNALFCIPGLGLAPWRIRDLYLWIMWRLGSSMSAFNSLRVIYSSWFYWNSDDDVSSESFHQELPLGDFARTKKWKLDLIVWCNTWNTIFQACLAGCMWGMDRFNRPSWTTGLFVCLACTVAGVGGFVTYKETRRTRNLQNQLHEVS